MNCWYRWQGAEDAGVPLGTLMVSGSNFSGGGFNSQEHLALRSRLTALRFKPVVRVEMLYGSAAIAPQNA